VGNLHNIEAVPEAHKEFSERIQFAVQRNHLDVVNRNKEQYIIQNGRGGDKNVENN
jgi:hypothetical protein